VSMGTALLTLSMTSALAASNLRGHDNLGAGCRNDAGGLCAA
jgi:hypothetical protein